MRRLATISIIATLIVAEVPARADDHKPPPTRLRSAGVHQKGVRTTYCWTRANHAVCVDYFGHSWPRARRHPGDTGARIKIGRGFRPFKVHLRGYRHLDENRQPKGDGFKIATRITKHPVDGRMRYFIRFRVTDKRGHLYLGLWTHLADETGERGDVFYDFHLKIE